MSEKYEHELYGWDKSRFLKSVSEMYVIDIDDLAGELAQVLSYEERDIYLFLRDEFPDTCYYMDYDWYVLDDDADDEIYLAVTQKLIDLMGLGKLPKQFLILNL